MVKISVIVPVYNTEAYLSRAIDSILAQSFEDFELILIDDGSTDSSSTICDDYCGKDSRVRVVHNENQGVSAARNCGIDMATGDWVTFIDSDDYVLPEYLQNLYDNSQKYNSDFVMTGIVRVHENNPDDKVIREWHELVVDKNDIEKLYEENILQYQKGPVIKLFKNEILKKSGVRFDARLSRGEDALFVYSYLLHCNVLSVAPGAYYYYCLRDGSLMSQTLASYEVERYGYESMKSVLLKLTHLSHPYPKRFLVYWFDRVINSIYSDYNGYDFRERMDFLKALDYSYYKKWKEPVSWKDGIKKSLLCGKHFFLYDLIFSR